jgi:hypothetical protein
MYNVTAASGASVGAIAGVRLSGLAERGAIRHGPRALLTTFFRAAESAARERGVQLSLRHDLAALVAINERERRHWYRISPLFDPAFSAVSPENSFWIEGRNEAGETVATQAARGFQWTGTTLKDESESLRIFYADPAAMAAPGETCKVTARAAGRISGRVAYSGSGWYRPDFRGRQLSAILPRISRACALASWGTDVTISFVEDVLIEKGVVARYGYRRIEHAIHWRARVGGDLAMAILSMTRAELVDDLRAFLSGAFQEISGPQHRDAREKSLVV